MSSGAYSPRAGHLEPGAFCATVRRNPTRATARGRKESTQSTPKLAHVKKRQDGGKPGVRFLDRSKRGIRSMPAWLVSGTRRRRKRSCGRRENKTLERCTPNDRKRCRIRDRSQERRRSSDSVVHSARRMGRIRNFLRLRASQSRARWRLLPSSSGPRR